MRPGDRICTIGAHRNASDVKQPGMLFGKVPRPPNFQAKRTAVQTRDAEARPGVVVRGRDFGGVAAPTEQLAERARDAVRAEWQKTQPSSDDWFAYLKAHPAGCRPGR